MKTTRETFSSSSQSALAKSLWAPVARVTLLFLLAAMAATIAAAQNIPQTPLANPIPRTNGVLLPAANRLPDANQVMEMHDQKNKDKNFAAANAERKKQIAEDTDKMVKLISDLKAEIDKTSKDELSLGVIRKADEIERLAHNIKEKMKLTAGPG